MTKFKLEDHVRKVGGDKVFTVEQIRTEPGKETTYLIQFGSDFASRELAKECELESA